MLRPRDPRVPADAAHSRRHASVKEWVDKMQAFWNWKNWKLLLLVGALLIILADGLKDLVANISSLPVLNAVFKFGTLRAGERFVKNVFRGGGTIAGISHLE